jgi:hypothetical protein
VAIGGFSGSYSETDQLGVADRTRLGAYCVRVLEYARRVHDSQAKDHNTRYSKKAIALCWDRFVKIRRDSRQSRL